VDGAAPGAGLPRAVGLIAYLGVDTVWSLIRGWMHLVEAANHATTFEELREAGERYGKVMGQNAARTFVMLATATIGNTVGLAVKGPRLPGSSQAAMLAESQAGFRFAALAEVESVAVSAEGAFTIALAPSAVAVATRAKSDSPSRSTLRPGPYAWDSIPARGPGRDFTAAEQQAMNEIGRKHGCHTCGTKNPGTKDGNFIPDHQPPSKLAPGEQQRRPPGRPPTPALARTRAPMPPMLPVAHSSPRSWRRWSMKAASRSVWARGSCTDRPGVCVGKGSKAGWSGRKRAGWSRRVIRWR
jgi:general stress protein YciG